MFDAVLPARGAHAWVLVAALVLGWAPGAHALTGAAAVVRCDELAADPYDPQKPSAVMGVFVDRIDVANAIRACQAAVQADPKSTRLKYQLVRAGVSELRRLGRGDVEPFPGIGQMLNDLQKSGYAAVQMMVIPNIKDPKKYAPIVADAAAHGHPLGELLHGVVLSRTGKTAEAKTYLQRAIDQGITLAYFEMGMLLRKDPATVQRRTELFFEAAMRGEDRALNFFATSGSGDQAYEARSYQKLISRAHANEPGGDWITRTRNVVDTLREKSLVNWEHSKSNLASLLTALGKRTGNAADLREAETVYVSAAQIGNERDLEKLFKFYAGQSRFTDAARALERLRAYWKKKGPELMRQSALTGVTEPYWEKTLAEYAARLAYERLPSQASGSLDDVRPFFEPEPGRFRGQHIVRAPQRMVNAVRAKTLEAYPYRLRVMPMKKHPGVLDFKAERMDGEDLCIRHDARDLDIEVERTRLRNSRDEPYFKIKGEITSNCAALFPTKIRMRCEIDVACRPDDDYDFDYCDNGSSSTTITLDAEDRSESFSMKVDFSSAPWGRDSLKWEIQCYISSIDGEAKRRPDPKPAFGGRY